MIVRRSVASGWGGRKLCKNAAIGNHCKGLKYMPFPLEERQALLKVKGVGETVVTRLEQLGIDSLAQLARADALEIVTQASVLVGSSCWKNSPQARAAIQAAIALAKGA
jgi:predicted flap endonuclease-1-like 5' DNA nuclease